MTKRVGHLLIIEVEDDDVCELCGEIAELRPYGPGGKRVCFPCGMKDPAEMERQLESRLMGDEGNHQ